MENTEGLKLEQVTFADFRNNAAAIVKKAGNGECIKITNQRQKNAVLMSEFEYIKLISKSGEFNRSLDALESLSRLYLFDMQQAKKKRNIDTVRAGKKNQKSLSDVERKDIGAKFIEVSELLGFSVDEFNFHTYKLVRS